MSAKRIVVIGGSAAGPKAAAKARRHDQNAEITILQKGPHFSMASCGYPYYVGGTFDSPKALISTPVGVERNATFFKKAKDITAIPNAEVYAIDTKEKMVRYRHVEGGDEQEIAYDKLVIATGAEPFRPPVPGIDLEGVTTLQSMADAAFLRKIRDEKVVKQACIIGAGLIGIETAEALREAGIEVTIVEMLPQMLSFFDWEMAKLVQNHCEAKGVNVIVGNAVASLEGVDGKVRKVTLKDGSSLDCQLAVIATGVRPRVSLA
jgi:NADPH-dependent 2,4-dienoyl-CoA reductase/sulfur reductase-like enzyme